MRVDGVAFESPAGLEDSTNYSYQARDTYEELSVEFELPIGRATAADEVLTEVSEGLEGYFASEYSTVARGDQVFVGQPGKFLQYRLDGGEQVVSKIVVANTAADGRAGGQRGDWIKLAWSAWPTAKVSAGAGVDAVVDPIVASFVPAGQARAPVLPGHVRQQAGDWVLDVPAHLVGPRTFIYEDTEAELRIELSVLDAGAGDPDLDPSLAIAGGEELTRSEHKLADGERLDVRVRSDADPNGDSTLILAKRKIDLVGAQAGEHRWVVLSANGPGSEAARLTRIVDALLLSVRAEEMT